MMASICSHANTLRPADVSTKGRLRGPRPCFHGTARSSRMRAWYWPQCFGLCARPTLTLYLPRRQVRLGDGAYFQGSGARACLIAILTPPRRQRPPRRRPCSTSRPTRSASPPSSWAACGSPARWPAWPALACTTRRSRTCRCGACSCGPPCLAPGSGSRRSCSSRARASGLGLALVLHFMGARLGLGLMQTLHITGARRRARRAPAGPARVPELPACMPALGPVWIPRSRAHAVGAPGAPGCAVPRWWPARAVLARCRAAPGYGPTRARACAVGLPALVLLSAAEHVRPRAHL